MINQNDEKALRKDIEDMHDNAHKAMKKDQKKTYIITFALFFLNGIGVGMALANGDLETAGSFLINIMWVGLLGILLLLMAEKDHLLAILIGLQKIEQKWMKKADEQLKESMKGEEHAEAK